MNLLVKIAVLAIASTLSIDNLPARVINDSSTPSQATYATLGQDQMEQFNKLMQQAIDKAEARVATAQQFATRHDVSPTWDSKLEMQQAITMLEVKKTLANNFSGTESLRSAAVRNKLLSLLNSSDITTADLAALQNLVLNEKERIREEDQHLRESQGNEENVFHPEFSNPQI